MVKELDTREKLIGAGTALFRKGGYGPTSVEEICAEAGVSKGAFFHYFASKEELALAALEQWDLMAAKMMAEAPFAAMEDPVKKVLGCVEFFAALFANPKVTKSCLAGVAAQEASETNAALRKAANACFVHNQERFKGLLDGACRKAGKKLDTASLAVMFMATLQGSLLLARASKEDAVVPGNLRHFGAYLEGLLT